VRECGNEKRGGIHHLQRHNTRVGDVDSALHVGAVVLVHCEDLEVGNSKSLQGIEAYDSFISL
jgi:hypothetical protein